MNLALLGHFLLPSLNSSYKNHYGLNLAMQQFCAHKEELLRVLDAPQLPLHSNAAEADIREYVTRHKILAGLQKGLGCR